MAPAGWGEVVDESFGQHNDITKFSSLYLKSCLTRFPSRLCKVSPMCMTIISVFACVWISNDTIVSVIACVWISYDAKKYLYPMLLWH